MRKEMLEEMYSYFLENQEQAPEKLKEAYSKMHRAIEEYVNEVEENVFRQAFTLGYQKGLQAAGQK